MDDIVDELYTAIKLYLTQISREALDDKEGRRWTDIVSFTINMEQVGDIIERVITDLEEKKIEKGRNFSDGGHAGNLRPARPAGRQPAAGHERVPAWRPVQRAAAARRKGAVPRSRARVCRVAHRAADQQHGAEHRDVVAAPRPDQRSEAHQFAHLLDRLPDPRAGRRAGQDPSEGAGGAVRCVRIRRPRQARWQKRKPHTV